MAALTAARLTLAALPFKWWRSSIGWSRSDPVNLSEAVDARRLAAHVDWASELLPFATKCLPRAMALSWMLRSKKIGHTVVFAVRPADRRGRDDDLHAWVEVRSEIVIGDLAGPWHETLRLGA